LGNADDLAALHSVNSYTDRYPVVLLLFFILLVITVLLMALKDAAFTHG